MEKIGSGTAIVCSAPTATMHSDVEHNFRQESDFFYLTGFNEISAMAVLAPHHEEHQFVLFVQPKEKERETWTGYRVGVEKAKEIYGAQEAYPIAELDEHLPKYLKKADKIYYRFGRNKRFDEKVLKHWQQSIRLYPKNGTGPISLEDPIATLHPLRSIKSPAELELMREATKIAIEAHLVARDIAKPGRYEYEVQAEMERVFRQRGGTGPAYPSIVASGPNACILHYTENERRIEEGDLVLIDAGCSYQYYNSDITRTFPANDRFSEEQKILYDIVLEAQKRAIAEIGPGKAYNLHHDVAVRTIVEGLMDLGLLAGDIEEIIKEEKYKPFYMHRTSHWLGLDVHDVGLYKCGEETWYALQPNQVLTVEPGIYIRSDIEPVEGQPAIDEKWHDIGIRIEDDVLVTADGNEVLTAAVPK